VRTPCHSSGTSASEAGVARPRWFAKRQQVTQDPQALVANRGEHAWLKVAQDRQANEECRIRAALEASRRTAEEEARLRGLAAARKQDSLSHSSTQVVAAAKESTEVPRDAFVAREPEEKYDSAADGADAGGLRHAMGIACASDGSSHNEEEHSNASGGVGSEKDRIIGGPARNTDERGNTFAKAASPRLEGDEEEDAAVEVEGEDEEDEVDVTDIIEGLEEQFAAPVAINTGQSVPPLELPQTQVALPRFAPSVWRSSSSSPTSSSISGESHLARMRALASSSTSSDSDGSEDAA